MGSLSTAKSGSHQFVNEIQPLQSSSDPFQLRGGKVSFKWKCPLKAVPSMPKTPSKKVQMHHHLSVSQHQKLLYCSLKPQALSFPIIFSRFLSSKHHQFPWISLGFLQTTPFSPLSTTLDSSPREATKDSIFIHTIFPWITKNPLLQIAENPSGFPSISFIPASNHLCLLEMAEVFQDEIDQTVTIEEYIKGVEEQELVTYLCFTL